MSAKARMHCQLCGMEVLKGAAGYGPWCELYFHDEGFACLPKALQSHRWLCLQGRYSDADILAEWIRRRYGEWAVTLV